MKKTTLCLMMFTLLMSGCATTPAPAPTPTINGQGYYGKTTMYRTMTERLSDELIERASHKNLPSIHGVNEKSVRIAINSFRREVLLTGEVPNEQVRAEVVKMVSAIQDVKKVHDNLTVTSTPKSQSHTVHEGYLKSKILAKIVSAGTVKSSQYKLVVRNNMAYVVAFVTAEQERVIMQSIEAVQGIEGVRIFGVRVDSDPSLLAKVDNSIADGEDTEGVIYGGQVAEQNATPFAITPMPTTPPKNTANTGHNPKAPIVRMDGKPTSSYVNLYNNTSKP